MRTVGIVQARMGSSRLPGKVLIELGGQPMLGCVLRRLQRAQRLDEVIVATSSHPGDEPIAQFCAAGGWRCFRGSENDVLERYEGAAAMAEADLIVRITSDCPAIDPGVVDDTLAAFFAGQPELDYTCNFHPRRTFPRGLDAEVLSRATLQRCFREATLPWDREHVTAYIYSHPGRFQVQGIEAEADYSAHRWTVDTPEDLQLLRHLYDFLGNDTFTWRDALAAVAQHPEWAQINAHVAQKKA